MAEETIIEGYRLAPNPVASGSTTQIYEVFDVETNERYAMKLLLDEAFKVAENRNSMKREFKVGTSFEHPNLMQVYLHRQTRQFAFFLMEFFGGANLKQIIRGDVVVVQSRFRKLFECILLGLAQMHEQGWLHRDLKPDNIMMTKGTDVRIIDFSLSSKIPSAMQRMMTKKTKQIQGTRTYIAPEIVRRKLPSIQSDLYSLGVTAFECLTGRPPFMGSTPNDLLIKHIQEPAPEPSAFNPNVTPEMNKWVQRLLSKKPENRPDSCADVLAEFRTVKIFHEDPEAVARERAIKQKEADSFVEEGMLDSRKDAARQAERKTESGTTAPSTPRAPQPAAQTNRTPAPPPRPQAPPQPTTQTPQAPPPGYPQMPPGYPAPPGWAPAAPVPQSPAPQTQRPQPAPRPAPPPPASKPAEPDEDLPFADELPDII